MPKRKKFARPSLKKLRAGLTRKGMAEKLGVHYVTWYRAETYGEVGPKLAAALSREFGVPMEVWDW